MADLSQAHPGTHPPTIPAPLTRSATIFAWSFGVMLPIACFVFDPIIFTELSYARFSVGAYLSAAIAIVALILNLTRIGGVGDHDVVRGVMFLAGIFALVLGIVILPLSVIGTLAAGIGIFGLVPFGTAYVYLRRGWPSGVGAGRSLRRIGYFLAGMGVPAAVVGSAQVLATSHVERSLQLALSPSEQEQRQGIAGLRQSFWCGPACLYWTYVSQGGTDGDPLFERAFQDAMGQTIDQWESRNILVTTTAD